MKLHRILPTIFSIMVSSPILAQSAPEPDPDYTAQCEMKGHNGMVTLVLCPEILSPEEFRQEGIIACDGRLPCGAWFWTDSTLVPVKAPESHDKLDKVAVQKSHGVWMNEANNLFSLGVAATE